MNKQDVIMIAEGLRRRGEYQGAVDYLVKYYQENPLSANVDFFRKRIVNNILYLFIIFVWLPTL